ncbi:MAG: hypothetical protein ACRD68_10515, partial [Pyrinomonadaceae bacterium]
MGGPAGWRSFISTLMLFALAPAALFTLPRGGGAEASGQAGKWELQAEKIIRPARQETASKGSPLAAVALKGGEKSGVSMARPAQAAGGAEYFVLNVEFRDAASRRAQFSDGKVSRIPGASVLTAIDRFVDLFVTNDAPYNALLQRDDVMRVEIAGRVEAPPPPVVEVLRLESKAIPDKIIRGGYQGLRGKGVIIAVVDTGVDFRHPDFITYDAAGQP